MSSEERSQRIRTQHGGKSQRALADAIENYMLEAEPKKVPKKKKKVSRS